MKARSSFRTHCFRHGCTHPDDEPCPHCENETLRRALAYRRGEDPLAEFDRTRETLRTVRELRLRHGANQDARNPMKTRCKVRCQRVTKEDWGQGRIVFGAEFSCVADQTTEENKAFFAATPNGQIKLQVMREDHFEAGRDYYVDFTPVSVPAAT